VLYRLSYGLLGHIWAPRSGKVNIALTSLNRTIKAVALAAPFQ
jgi:hypothetical protein